MEVKVINKSKNNLPKYANPGDSGLDLQADFSEGVNKKFLFDSIYKDDKITIFPGGRALVPTNLYTSIPEGYEVQIRPRSGLALKNGISVLNTPGTVDPGYRNSWGVILINHSMLDSFEINQGDRIAQAVLCKVEKIEWNNVLFLDETERNLGGFGSSGIK